MIWFSMLVRGLWERRTKWCGNLLLQYGRLEWQWTLQDMEKAPDVAYEDDLKEFDSVCGETIFWQWKQCCSHGKETLNDLFKGEN